MRDPQYRNEHVPARQFQTFALGEDDSLMAPDEMKHRIKLAVSERVSSPDLKIPMLPHVASRVMQEDKFCMVPTSFALIASKYFTRNCWQSGGTGAEDSSALLPQPQQHHPRSSPRVAVCIVRLMICRRRVGQQRYPPLAVCSPIPAGLPPMPPVYSQSG